MRYKLIAALCMLLGLSHAAMAEVKLGLVAPLTGDQALYGQMMKRGMEAAVDDINRAGGIKGQPIRLLQGDDRCDPKEAVNVASKMVNDGVLGVMGHFCSGTSLPASDVYADAGVIQISPGSTAPKLTQRGLPTLFRVCGQDNAQGDLAAQYVLQHLNDAKVGVVHDRRTYGKGLSEAFISTLNKGGMQVVLQDTLNPGDKDFSSLVTRLRGSGVTVLYYGGYHPELALLLRQMQQAQFMPKVFSGDAMGTDELGLLAGPAAKNVTYSEGTYPSTDALRTLKDRAVAQHRTLDVYEVYSYAATQALAAALQQSDTTPLGLAQYLKTHSTPSVMGNLEFNEQGDIKTPFFELKAYPY